MRANRNGRQTAIIFTAAVVFTGFNVASDCMIGSFHMIHPFCRAFLERQKRVSPVAVFLYREYSDERMGILFAEFGFERMCVS